MKALVRHDDSPVIIDGPQPFIKGPVRVLAERKTVFQVIVLAFRPGLDVRGIHDRCAVNGETAIASKGTRKLVFGDNLNCETRATSLSLRRFCRFFQNLGRSAFLNSRPSNPDHLKESDLLSWWKVFLDQYHPGLQPKIRTGKKLVEFRVHFAESGRFGRTGGSHVCLMDGPEILTLEVVKRHSKIEPGRPAISHDGTVVAEAEHHPGGAGKGTQRKFTRLDHVEDAQEQKRLVRGRARMPLLGRRGIELRELSKPERNLVFGRSHGRAGSMSYGCTGTKCEAHNG